MNASRSPRPIRGVAWSSLTCCPRGLLPKICSCLESLWPTVESPWERWRRTSLSAAGPPRACHASLQCHGSGARSPCQACDRPRPTQGSARSASRFYRGRTSQWDDPVWRRANGNLRPNLSFDLWCRHRHTQRMVEPVIDKQTMNKKGMHLKYLNGN